MMYIICIVIIIIVCEKNTRYKLYQILCDTALYPSFIAFGFSIGQIAIKTKSVITDYIFRTLLWLSIGGIIFAIFIGTITYFIQKKAKKEESEGIQW